MNRATAEERALARATMYRLLALLFSYPTPAVASALRESVETAGVAADLIDQRAVEALGEVGALLDEATPSSLESEYQRAFTLSYNEDCPLYETAFSARHIFQQTQHQADLAGFYRAFGVDSKSERPDHLAIELEFLYLTALKEALARGRLEREHVAVCRGAQRAFLRDHLARWAPSVAGRIAVAGRATLYEASARLLLAFVSWEERYLRLGTVVRFTDEPVLIADEPGEFACPFMDDVATVAIDSIQVREEGHDALAGRR
jgi:TorA maturation chaperone TorD